LIGPIDLQAVEVAQHLWGFDARCPYHEFGRDECAIGERQAFRGYLRHRGAGADLDTHAVEQALGGLGDAFRQPGQDTRGGFDQYDADVALRVDAVEPVADHFADGTMQCCGQFRAGCAGADDRHVKLARTHRAFLRLRAQAGVDHAPVEALGLRRCLQRHGIFDDAGCAEIVGDAADRDHQRVVTDRGVRRDQAPFVVENSGEPDLFPLAVEPDHLAEAIAEPVPMGLGEVVHFVGGGIDGAGRHGVQQRLPDMGAGTIHQGDGRPSAPAQPVAEAGCEFQPSRAAAHHHNPVQRRFGGAIGFAGRRRVVTPIGARQVVVCQAVQDVCHIASLRVPGGGRGAVGAGRWARGGGRGAVGAGRWAWGGGRGAVGVGRWAWGGGRGAVGVGRCAWVREPENGHRPAAAPGGFAVVQMYVAVGSAIWPGVSKVGLRRGRMAPCHLRPAASLSAPPRPPRPGERSS